MTAHPDFTEQIAAEAKKQRIALENSIKTGEYSFKMPAPKAKRCLKWERQQVVSDEELEHYRLTRSLYPDMVDDDYQTHEEVCVERSEEEEPLHIRELPDWIDQFTPYP